MRQITKKQLLSLAVALSCYHFSNAILEFNDEKCGLLLPWMYLFPEEFRIISRSLRGILWVVSPVRPNEVCSDKYYLRIIIPLHAYKL